MNSAIRSPQSASRHCLLIVWLLLSGAACHAAAPVRYTLSLDDRPNHRVAVSARFTTARSEFVAWLPVWNALYRVRDFSQYVTGMRVVSANATIEKVQKNAWRVRLTNGSPAGQVVVLEYDYYADQPGPFGIQLNDEHAFINPAEALIFTEEQRNAPVELALSGLAPGWNVATVLKENGGAWHARNYDDLADSPFEVSDFEEAEFSAGRGNYRIVVHAAHNAFPMEMVRGILERIVLQETAMMRDVPFDRYTFFYHFGEGGGGMEHRYCTAIDSADQQHDPGGERLASVSAHEFFHLWNVKRIRPAALEPVNYLSEQYTRSLWFSEGVTSTYGSYALLRSGLMTRERFLRHLADSIRDLDSRPAHIAQSAEESSVDAWLEEYRFYSRPERSISYYEKGEIDGILIDLAIRAATRNHKSLDDVMRYMNERFAKAGKYFAEGDIQASAEAVAGTDLSQVFEALVRSAQPIAYDRFFREAGLALKQADRVVGALGFTPSRGMRGVRVGSVDRSGPAAKADVREGDEVIEVNGTPASELLPADGLMLEPDQKLNVKLRRAGREFTLRYRAGHTTQRVFDLAPLPNATEMQLKIREGWLAGTTEQ